MHSWAGRKKTLNINVVGKNVADAKARVARAELAVIDVTLTKWKCSKHVFLGHVVGHSF